MKGSLCLDRVAKAVCGGRVALGQCFLRAFQNSLLQKTKKTREGAVPALSLMSSIFMVHKTGGLSPLPWAPSDAYCCQRNGEALPQTCWALLSHWATNACVVPQQASQLCLGSSKTHGAGCRATRLSVRFFWRELYGWESAIGDAIRVFQGGQWERNQRRRDTAKYYDANFSYKGSEGSGRLWKGLSLFSLTPLPAAF